MLTVKEVSSATVIQVSQVMVSFAKTLTNAVCNRVFLCSQDVSTLSEAFTVPVPRVTKELG